jgi:hypothetical protein
VANFRGRLEDPRDAQSEDEIATSAALSSENAVKSDLLRTTEHRGNMTLRQGTGNGESFAIGAMTVLPLSTPCKPSIWAVSQSERLHNVRLHTLPFSQ